MSVRLGVEEMRYIALFESLTGANVRDCLMSDGKNKLTFVVESGCIGRAIGRRGNNIRRVRRIIGKSVEVVEYSDDPVKFIKNLLAPAKVRDIKVVEEMGKKVAYVSIDELNKGLAVGRGGGKIKRARMLAARHHGISELSLV